jgi:hypothetical protein
VARRTLAGEMPNARKALTKVGPGREKKPFLKLNPAQGDALLRIWVLRQPYMLTILTGIRSMQNRDEESGDRLEGQKHPAEFRR